MKFLVEFAPGSQENRGIIMSTLNKYFVLLGLFLPIWQSAFAGADDTRAESPVSPARSAADLERDARDKPLKVLEFAGIKTGMHVADIFGGGGYYAEILSALVGEKGSVTMVNNAPYDAYFKDEVAQRLADNRLPNVEYRLVENEALGLGSNRLDAAIIIITYHDFFYEDKENGWPMIDRRQFVGQIVTALRPGGRLLVVDHAAREGAGSDDTKTLHRIDEQFAMEQLQASGLKFVGSIPDLRNPEDSRELSVFDPAIRGKTDRFVHVYEKAE